MEKNARVPLCPQLLQIFDTHRVTVVILPQAGFLDHVNAGCMAKNLDSNKARAARVHRGINITFLGGGWKRGVNMVNMFRCYVLRGIYILNDII